MIFRGFLILHRKVSVALPVMWAGVDRSYYGNCVSLDLERQYPVLRLSQADCNP